MTLHKRTAVAVAALPPSEPAEMPSCIVDVVCSCGKAFRVRDLGQIKPGKLPSGSACLNPHNLAQAIFAIQREDVQLGQVPRLGARDVDGIPLQPGDFVEEIFESIVQPRAPFIGYVDRYAGPNIVQIERVYVIVLGGGVLMNSGRVWRKLPAAHDQARAMRAWLLETRHPTSQPLEVPLSQVEPKVP